ncbi:hypothetical protein Tco_0966666 [Tanacetum coccineum]
MDRKVQEDWEAEEEVKKLADEEAIKTALSNEYDFIQARLKLTRTLALKTSDEIDESSSLWKKEQSSFMIQLQLKEGFLQNKELMQSGINLLQELTLYEKVKRFDESFTAIGSIKDERRIKEMNEGVKYPDQKSLKKRVVEETPKKEDTAKVPAKVDVKEQSTRRERWSYEDDCKEKEKTSTRCFITRGDYLVIHRANGNFRAFNYLLEETMIKVSILSDQQDCEDCYLEIVCSLMLDLGLEVERGSIAALDLIRFIKQQIDEN